MKNVSEVIKQIVQQKQVYPAAINALLKEPLSFTQLIRQDPALAYEYAEEFSSTQIVEMFSKTNLLEQLVFLEISLPECQIVNNAPFGATDVLKDWIVQNVTTANAYAFPFSEKTDGSGNWTPSTMPVNVLFTISKDASTNHITVAITSNKEEEIKKEYVRSPAFRLEQKRYLERITGVFLKTLVKNDASAAVLEKVCGTCLSSGNDIALEVSNFSDKSIWENMKTRITPEEIKRVNDINLAKLRARLPEQMENGQYAEAASVLSKSTPQDVVNVLFAIPPIGQDIMSMIIQGLPRSEVLLEQASLKMKEYHGVSQENLQALLKNYPRDLLKLLKKAEDKSGPAPCDYVTQFYHIDPRMMSAIFPDFAPKSALLTEATNTTANTTANNQSVSTHSSSVGTVLSLTQSKISNGNPQQTGASNPVKPTK